MSMAKFSVKNSVLVNLLMIGLFIFGIISMFRMPRELNPNVNFNWVFVTVVYPGAAPSEIENLIIDPIESEIQDVDKITETQSTAGEGFGFLLIKFGDISDSEFRERYTDLKAEIDKVPLPEDAEDPIIDDFGSGDFLPVITINMSYSIPDDNASQIADDLEEDLTDIKGVSKVQVSGLAQREIWIEVEPAKLSAYGLSIEDVMFALSARNLNVPGGNLTFGKTEYLIRSLGEYQSIEEIRQSIIRCGPNKLPIQIRDIARVEDRREELNIISRMDRKKSITFSISKKSDANSIDVINTIKSLVKEYQNRVPDGITFGWTNDNAVYINRIVNVLRNNAISGMILIMLILYLFLGKSNAALASLGIPISFFITFILLDFFGFTFNGSTLFALVMVLGIIVDDAIIVLENCHRYRLMGYNSYQAAITGSDEVVAPIFSSIATNIAAFLPLMLLPGIMGKFMRIVPITYSLALLASMFEAYLLLPSHYADWTVHSKVYKRGEKKFFKVMRKFYGHLLIKVIRKRYLLLPVLLLVLIGSLALIPMVGVEMFGEEDADQFKVLIRLPEGASLEESDRILRKYEEAAISLPRSSVQSVIVNVGLLQGNEEWITKKNVGQLLIELIPQEQREHPIDALIEMLRAKTQGISGVVSVEFEKIAGGPPVGKPISVKVQGKYFEEMKKASLALQDSIKELIGTQSVTDDFPPGKEEIRIQVDENKAAMLGFSAQRIALAVRYAFDGIKATEYRDGDDEIDVIVKYNQTNRSSLEDVLNLKLSSPAGQSVALRDMVTFTILPGPTEIKRFDRKRTILVTGDIDENQTTLDKVNLRLEKIFPLLEKKYPGITFKIGGQFEEFVDTFKEMAVLFALGVILIFLILGTQFNSYSQPLIILSTVPFSLIGAMLGLIISGNPFSVVALFGVVALSGIVVNDAIVLIDFMNHRRANDMGIFQYWRSIVNAGRLRLRPIILTSLTTISGLIPMAFGIGGISLMWSPLANVILFGMIISTLLTLFVIPSFVAILDDIKGVRKKLLTK